MQVGLQGEELKAALIACPAVLLYDARTNLRKKYAYFTKGIGLDPADFRELLAKVTNSTSYTFATTCVTPDYFILCHVCLHAVDILLLHSQMNRVLCQYE
jgi:hypothetical protein